MRQLDAARFGGNGKCWQKAVAAQPLLLRHRRSDCLHTSSTMLSRVCKLCMKRARQIRCQVLVAKGTAIVTYFILDVCSVPFAIGTVATAAQKG